MQEGSETLHEGGASALSFEATFEAPFEAPLQGLEAPPSFWGLKPFKFFKPYARQLLSRVHLVKTRGAFRDLRVEPSGKVTAANSYPKHNPTQYNQTNRRALTKLCLGQAAQNKLSSCGCKAVLQAPDFTSFSLVSLEPHRPATAPSLQLLKHSLLRHFKVAQKLPKQAAPNWFQS